MYQTYKFLEQDRESGREDPYIYMVFRTGVLETFGYNMSSMSSMSELKRMSLADFAYRLIPSIGSGGFVQIVKDRSGKTHPGCYVTINFMIGIIEQHYKPMDSIEAKNSLRETGFVASSDNITMLTLSSGIIIGEEGGNVVFSLPMPTDQDAFVAIDDLSQAEDFAKAILMFVDRARKERAK